MTSYTYISNSKKYKLDLLDVERVGVGDEFSNVESGADISL